LYSQAEEKSTGAFPVLVERFVVMMAGYGLMGFCVRASVADHAAVEAALGRVGKSEFSASAKLVKLFG